jgi:hypothetical protein
LVAVVVLVGAAVSVGVETGDSSTRTGSLRAIIVGDPKVRVRL